MSKRIGFIIPIRLASERLPRKALLNLKGMTVFENLLRRIKLSKYYKDNNVVICTTNCIEDDELVNFLTSIGVKSFRGSKDDIIDRFYNACCFYEFDYLIQIDGDDPLTEPLYMDKCMDEIINNATIDIAYPEGLPIGLASKAFTFSALKKVNELKMDSKNDTGFIYYFTKTNLFNKKVIDVPSYHKNSNARFTLDYKEDLDFFESVLTVAERNNNVAQIDELLTALKNNLDLVLINSSLEKEYWERTNKLVSLKIKDNKGQVYEI